MRKSANLQRRAAQVVAIQSLKTTASRAEFAEATAARIDADAALDARDSALDAGLREMDALLAFEALDFDRWRIGRAMIADLALARDEAAEQRACREAEEQEARAVLSRETTREERVKAMYSRLVRRLAEKRDDAAMFEANGRAIIRTAMGQV